MEHKTSFRRRSKDRGRGRTSEPLIKAPVGPMRFFGRPRCLVCALSSQRADEQAVYLSDQARRSHAVPTLSARRLAHWFRHRGKRPQSGDASSPQGSRDALGSLPHQSYARLAHRCLQRSLGRSTPANPHISTRATRLGRHGVVLQRGREPTPSSSPHPFPIASKADAKVFVETTFSSTSFVCKNLTLTPAAVRSGHEHVCDIYCPQDAG